MVEDLPCYTFEGLSEIIFLSSKEEEDSQLHFWISLFWVAFAF
jgi:hypothetical protein